VVQCFQCPDLRADAPGVPGTFFLGESDVRFTSPSRRAAGLLAATTIGLSTAVLSVTGIASAVPTVITGDDSYAASTNDDVPATGITVDPGYCYGIFTAIGGQGGGTTLNGTDGGLGGGAELWAPVTAGEVYTFAPGQAGVGGAAGAGGVNAGRPADNGSAGTDAGAGGGAGSAVLLGGQRVVGGAGGTGAGTGGGLGGGANYIDTARDFMDRGPGQGNSGWSGSGLASAIIVGCDAPEAPNVSYVTGDGAATVAFYPTIKGDYTAAATGYEYSLDGGTNWEPISSTPTGGELNEQQFTIPALTNDHEYSVVMRARSDVNGNSETSAAKTFSLHHYVGGPATAKLTGGPSSVTFSWTPSPDAAKVTGYSMRAYPQEFEGDPEAPGAPVMASCEAPANATSCVAAATPGFTYAGFVGSVEGEYGGGDTDAGTTAKIVGPTAPSELPKANAPLTSSDADGAVTAGQQVTLSGSGYLAGSTVELTVYSTPVSLGQAVVGADGTFSATVTVPKDLANGTHHLVASGVDANGNPRYLVVEITVSGGTASGLAYTGFSALPYAGAGVLALLAGGGLLVASRRRAS
jgi:hypothetical protein